MINIFLNFGLGAVRCLFPKIFKDFFFTLHFVTFTKLTHTSKLLTICFTTFSANCCI